MDIESIVYCFLSIEAFGLMLEEAAIPAMAFVSEVPRLIPCFGFRDSRLLLGGGAVVLTEW